MKFGKEEITRIILGVILLIAAVYSYFSLLLWPLEARRTAYQEAMAELDPKIAAARDLMTKAAATEKTAPAAQAVISQINALIPPGSPVAWFPPRIGEFFRNHGVEKSSTRLVTEGVDKEIEQFRRTTWNLDFPRIEFVPFASALAEFENDEPLVEIISLTVETNRDNVQSQHAVLVLHNTVKK